MEGGTVVGSLRYSTHPGRNIEKIVKVQTKNSPPLYVSYTGGKVTDESIKAVAASCTSLISLNVSNTGGKVTDESIKAVAASCTSLTSLDVSWTDGKVTDESIRAIELSSPGCVIRR